MAITITITTTINTITIIYSMMMIRMKQEQTPGSVFSGYSFGTIRLTLDREQQNVASYSECGAKQAAS